MRKSLAPLLILIFLTTSYVIVVKPASSSDAAENSWVSKAPMHQARTGLGVAVVNGKIYAIGGTTASGFMPGIGGNVLGLRDLGGIVGTNEEYDPTTDTWTTKASMPTPRIVFATAVYQNKIYCIGGRNIAGSASGYFSGINEVYNPATDTWETRAPMPTPRGWVTASVINSEIYLIGGEPNGTLNEVYDPATDSWVTKTPVPSAASGSDSAVVDNKIYVIGSKLQIYDPETDKWSQGAPPPSSMEGEGAGATIGVLASKRIHVIGPQDPYNPSHYIYDPKSDSWTFGAELPTERSNFGVAVVNDRLYAIGGHTYSFLGDFAPVALNEQYTPLGYGSPDPTYVPPDSTVPEISVMSPENETCYTTNVPLSFTVNKPDTWMRYKLDGKTVVEVEGNSTLAGLSAGLHNITIFVTDAAGNTGASETIYFTVDDTAPVVSVTAPENKTYKAAEIPLNFTVNEKVSRMEYSLDSQPNIPITGNTTLTGVPNGAHNITVYAQDIAGNTGVSETIYFSVEVPFPTTLVIAASASVVVVIVGLLVYFKKRNH